MSEENKKKPAEWKGNHAVDARYNVPWFSKPVYLRVMLGRERRTTDRIKAHNAESKRRSYLNIVLFAIGASLLYTAIAAILLIISSVIE